MKRNFGVKAKLLTSFFVFSIFIIVLLWLLEVVFLDDVYRSIKIHSVRNTAQSMEGLSDRELEELVEESSTSFGLCISVFDERCDLLMEAHTNGQCVVHNLSPKTIALFYQTTAKFESGCFESLLPAREITEIIKRNESVSSLYQNFFRSEEPPLSASSDAYDCVLYSQIFQNSAGEERYALLSAVLLPMDATMETIRWELNIVIGTLIFLSFFTAFILSKTISTPIVELNQAAKSLPEGQFDGEKIKGYREVTELADTLSKSAREIRQVDRLRRELLANVSHDLRTPLTLISGYSEVMRDIPGENTRENLQVVIDEAHRLSDLVTDMLDLSKMEAGMEKLSPERVELVSFLRDILGRYEKLTGVQGYTIEFTPGCDQIFVMADLVKLNQIVYNLVNNAIHYCGEDRWVGVKLYPEGERAVVEIVDHGEGIPEDQIGEIWDRYYRVDKNHRSQKVGSGLGLSIVKELLALHGAEFGVRSTVGQGSVFWFSLKTVSNN